MQKSLLIVDDSLFMRAWLKKIIKESFDINFLEAENGIEAINKYKQFIPQLVLMDITMDGLNGIETLKELIRFDSKATVIMCSALGNKSLITDALKIGAKDFVIKPNFQNLNSTIQKFL
ncbi:response regulator [Ureibacillus sp. NPDC094379]